MERIQNMSKKKIKKQIKKEAKTTAHFLNELNSLGMETTAAHLVLAELPDGISLSQVIELLRPITDNYREQIDLLRGELGWTYQALDTSYPDYFSDIARGFNNYQGAITALNTYTQSWFAEQPVSYEKLTEIAGYIKERLLLFLLEADIPNHINNLIDGQYEQVIALRQMESNSDEADEDQTDTDE